MENKNIFAQWDNNADLKGIDKDIREAEQNGGNFKDVPYGNYEVSIEKMELVATKEKKKPMVSVWMEIVNDGEFKGQKIFMNRVIDPKSEWAGLNIHQCNEFLRSLIQGCEDAPVVEFKSFSQYAELLMDIHELIADRFEYSLQYGKNKKGFDTFEITESFVLED